MQALDHLVALLDDQGRLAMVDRPVEAHEEGAALAADMGIGRRRRLKDADLIGIPFRITLGKKLVSGNVEMVDRRSKQSTDVPLTEAAARVRSRVYA